MSHVDDTAHSERSGEPALDVPRPYDHAAPQIDAEPVTGEHGVVTEPGRTGATDVAPRPPRQRRSEWRRAERARRYAARNSVRFPVFTRSILLWWLVFALTGLAFGASGAFWWANFNSQVSDLRKDTEDFEERSLEAQSLIETQRQEALAEIDQALEPMQGFLSETQMLALAELFSPSVYTVASLDDEGLPAVGTGFAVIGDDRYTWLVTSFETVRAASVAPGPDITIRKGTEETGAELWNWDPDRDLALIRVEKAGVPLLDWVDEQSAAQALGSRIFPVSGLGGAGAKLTTGVVVDQSAPGFQHTAPLGTDFQGGPIVDVDGKIVGVASLRYQPLGFDPGDVRFAVPIGEVCQALISCGGGARAAPPRN
jgi:S1-C subfamily serine protease